MSYYLSKILQTPFDDAVEKVTEELRKEGFGVLTDIDMQGTMKKKLNVDIQKYRILGACNPPLAHRALTADPGIGLMLPCNVTVEELSPDNCLIRLADPKLMLQAGFENNPEMQNIAEEAHQKISRVAAALTEMAK